MDFTLDKYKSLLSALKAYIFQSLTLRHDVDLLPQNSLRTAKMEAEMGMKGIYYFRAVPESWDEAIIKEIAALGHEIGYHYVTVAALSPRRGPLPPIYATSRGFTPACVLFVPSGFSYASDDASGSTGVTSMDVICFAFMFIIVTDFWFDNVF